MSAASPPLPLQPLPQLPSSSGGVSFPPGVRPGLAFGYAEGYAALLIPSSTPFGHTSGFSKVDVSAFRPQWRDGRDGGVDGGGTGSAAGHVPASGATADPASGGSAARAERAPDPAPAPRIHACRSGGLGVAAARAPE